MTDSFRCHGLRSKWPRAEPEREAGKDAAANFSTDTNNQLWKFGGIQVGISWDPIRATLEKLRDRHFTPFFSLSDGHGDSSSTRSELSPRILRD
eukprot:s3758_g3.t1